MEVGEWVQVSLGILFSFGKSSKNCPRPVLIFWSSIICVVVNYYDFSVLSTSVMGFQKEKFGWWWVGWVSSIQFYFGFLEFFNFAKPAYLVNEEVLAALVGAVHLQYVLRVVWLRRRPRVEVLSRARQVGVACTEVGGVEGRRVGRD